MRMGKIIRRPIFADAYFTHTLSDFDRNTLSALIGFNGWVSVSFWDLVRIRLCRVGSRLK